MRRTQVKSKTARSLTHAQPARRVQIAGDDVQAFDCSIGLSHQWMFAGQGPRIWPG